MRLVLAFVVLALGCARASVGNGANDSRSGDGAGQGDGARAIDAAIDGNGCATQPCDIPTQCGCGTGMACDIDPMTQMGTACRMVTTAGVETNTCATDTACAAGYVCVGDGTNDACQKYCTSNSDCTAPRGQCVIQLTNAMGNPIAGAVVCSSNCNPSAVNNATTCPSGWSCDLFTATYNATMYDIADCRKAGTAGQNAACSATVACAAGYSCVNNGTSNVCGRVCQPNGGGPACPGVTTCLHFTTAFVVGGTEYGVCL